MKPEPGQMTFETMQARVLKPDSMIREPVVWFQSLRFLRQLGIGSTEENCIRSFTFRQGLNILWAEPEDPAESAGLYRDGFAGHSTGKTLFCRVLRYLLGEPNYGTADLEEHVKSTFQHLWAVAEIRLDARTWLVGRALSKDGGEFAILDGVPEAIFREVPPFTGYKRFTEQLENVCGPPLVKMHPEEGWRNLLPWLARDQEARFASISAWRDSSSEAENPRNSVGAQHLILRAYLRLLEEKEYSLRQNISEIEERIKMLKADMPVKEALAASQLATVRRTVGQVPGLRIELADLDTAKRKIVDQRTIREESLDTFRNEEEKPEVKKCREELEAAVSAKARSEGRIKSLEEEIPAEEARARDLLLTVNRFKFRDYLDYNRVADNWCPHSFEYARKQGCVPSSGEPETMAEIADLERGAEALSKAVQAKIQEKARLESRSDQLNAEVLTKTRAFSKAVSKFPTALMKIQRHIHELERAEQELSDAIDARDNKMKIETEIHDAETQIVGFRNEMLLLKARSEGNVNGFSDIFADIARAILGTSIAAFADLGERTINLHIKRNGRELGGAAVETIKTLTFDIAAVVQSIEGKCDHPRFLIHDGPREADMARVTYEHFFLLARKLENSLGENGVSFQYILTTTTHPPDDMQEGSKWLLGEKLSGKSKEGRLLKEDF